jgi:acyl dehydratase
MLHYEDFHEGLVIPFGTYHLTREEVIEFAREFDPQPFHLDEAAAKLSVLGGLSASGWHTCAIIIRLATDAYVNNSATMASNGMDEVKWLKPVHAGETLTGRLTIVSRRRSASKPDRGILKCCWELFNVAGEKKAEITGVQFMRLRQP